MNPLLSSTPRPAPQATAWSITEQVALARLKFAASDQAQAFLDGPVAALFASHGHACKVRASRCMAHGQDCIADITPLNNPDSLPVFLHAETIFSFADFQGRLHMSSRLKLRLRHGAPLDHDNEDVLMALPKTFSCVEYSAPKQSEKTSMKKLRHALQSGIQGILASAPMHEYLQKLVQPVVEHMTATAQATLSQHEARRR